MTIESDSFPINCTKTVPMKEPINAVTISGCICLIVIFYGLNGKASIINGPVVAFEVTQQGSNGLYLLYLMAVYLAVFAITMLLQFTSFFMGSSYKLLNSKEN